MNQRTAFRLLGIAGSLRRESHSAAVLRAMHARLPSGFALEAADIGLPLYNEDEDGPHSAKSVTALRRAVAECDGIVLVTPEYNHGMPGVVKNALDWLSRPHGESAMIGKPTLVISTSAAFTGGVRAHAQINETLLGVQARLVPGPQVVIGSIGAKVHDGKLTDEESLAFIIASVERMALPVGV